MPGTIGTSLLYTRRLSRAKWMSALVSHCMRVGATDQRQAHIGQETRTGMLVVVTVWVWVCLLFEGFC